ncbi:hypothetical protein BT96DRAFT_828538, partial [Gymnopus androsaceus JB14]
LPMFFEEFEAVATTAGINNDHAAMKKGVLRYTDQQSMRFWRTLPTYEDATKMWIEFKDEVLVHYPGALKDAESTMEDLRKVVSKYAGSGVTNSKELLTYHCDFLIVVRSLLTNGILSGVQVASIYTKAFSETIRNHLDTRLQVKYPQKPKGQAYTLTKLHEATDYLLSNASTTVKAGNFSMGDRSKVPVSSITASVAPKVESTESKLDQLSQVVASLTQLMTHMVKGGESSSSSSGSGFHPPKMNRSSKCFWDNCDSTKFDNCADLSEWVSKGCME